MKEKKYKLTEKGKKLLKNYDSNINMQEYAAKLLGFDRKVTDESRSKKNTL